MAYTLSDLENLRQRIAEGVSKVRFSDGREMTFRSLDEMRRIEESMIADLGLNPSTSRGQHYFTPRRMS
jgi:hypothetical protein